jgi:cytochrome oxidase Cu insertion factor (SCO1/SenC/PrrC family)
MNRWFGIVFGLAVVLANGANAGAAPEEKTGLRVGEKAPEFTLKDQSGTERSLRDLLKGGPVAIVFYRSAGW